MFSAEVWGSFRGTEAFRETSPDVAGEFLRCIHQEADQPLVMLSAALFGLTRQRFGLRIVPERSSKKRSNVEEISIAVEIRKQRAHGLQAHPQGKFAIVISARAFQQLNSA